MAFSGRVVGRLPVVVDSKYVQQPFAQDVDPAVGNVYSHLDLWGGLADLRRRGLGTGIELYKIKSHQEASVSLPRGDPFWAWFGNYLVDELAGEMAKKLALPDPVLKELDAYDAMATKIQKRITEVIRQTEKRTTKLTRVL